MSLTEFLLARIAEDETLARSVMDDRPQVGHSRAAWAVAGMPEPAVSHVLRWGPKAVLAECEAKRTVITTAAMYGPEDSEIYAAFLTEFAAVYADHPDYREEWKVPTDAA